MRKHVAVGAAFAVASAVACASAHAFIDTPDRQHAALTVATTVHLSVTTSVVAAGLYPGKVTAAVVTIDNPNGFPLAVTSISAGRSSAFTNSSNGQPCPAATVTTSAWADATGLVQTDGSTKTIAAGGAARYFVTVAMSATQSGDGCAGTTFDIPVTVIAIATT